ncbi:MAG: hypothetical protein IJ983_01185 [Kiritimatiellae bacterium]|nr:hypothetical protein [Kiritimatiellia bacterium]MBR2938279.1 hypothetical protein [Kiritimatiellia bacterium]
MKRAVPYVNESVATRDLKYYIFDWDDNILHMPTKIRMERLEDDGTWRPVELSTATFALVRSDTEHYRAPGGKWREAFRNFEDSPQRDNFLEDTRAALARIAAGERPGPSFNALRKTLREGRIFAIVTARGHSPAAVERAVRCFIDEVLTPEEREEMMSSLRGYRQWLDGVGDGEFGTDEEELDYYLSMCRYSAVTYEGFAKRMAADPIYQEKLAVATTAAQPELAKEFAIRDFVEHVFHMLRRSGNLNRPVSIGFSDDDKGNVKSVSRYIVGELARRFEGIKFVVYDTSDRTLSKGRKVCVSGQLNLPGF